MYQPFCFVYGMKQFFQAGLRQIASRKACCTTSMYVSIGVDSIVPRHIEGDGIRIMEPLLASDQ